MAPPAETLRQWLALLRTPGLGPVGLQRLLDRFGGVEQIMGAPVRELRQAGLSETTASALHHVDWGAVDADLAWTAEPMHHALVLQDPAYPRLLREIHDPPPVLFVVGDPGCLGEPQIAMVGSRNPTPAGERIAHDFARHFAGRGLVITSGLALGIDAAAHRGALAGGGRTIAVAGNGLDRVYPARHRDLAREIAMQGAIVSELPPGTPPKPEHFPRRNRIIAGLSLGTLVVEAAARSGSLITAHSAMEAGREVFAIPGSIHNPLARGCHALIRQGAKLVETAEDVLEEMGSLALVAQPGGEMEPVPRASEDLDEDYRRLLTALGFEPTAVDTLVERTGLTAEVLSSMLLILELKGQVASTPGGLYTRVTDEVPS